MKITLENSEMGLDLWGAMGENIHCTVMSPTPQMTSMECRSVRVSTSCLLPHLTGLYVLWAPGQEEGLLERTEMHGECPIGQDQGKKMKLTLEFSQS